jgi:hypothetical protein
MGVSYSPTLRNASLFFEPFFPLGNNALYKVDSCSPIIRAVFPMEPPWVFHISIALNVSGCRLGPLILPPKVLALCADLL